MDERTGDRWLSTAMVRHLSKPLPSVDLIQIGEVYVVVDGHKKISVAQAFGEQAIDAKLMVWDIERPLPVIYNTSKDKKFVSHATIGQYG